MRLGSNLRFNQNQSREMNGLRDVAQMMKIQSSTMVDSCQSVSRFTHKVDAFQQDMTIQEKDTVSQSKDVLGVKQISHALLMQPLTADRSFLIRKNQAILQGN